MGYVHFYISATYIFEWISNEFFLDVLLRRSSKIIYKPRGASMVADNNNLINSAFIINKLDSSFWMIRRVLFKT